MTISFILTSISDRAVSPDLPGITRLINSEILPLLRKVRYSMNQMIAAVHVPEYAQGDEPTVTGSAIVSNKTTGKLRYTTDGGATWTDLP